MGESIIYRPARQKAWDYISAGVEETGRMQKYAVHSRNVAEAIVRLVAQQGVKGGCT